MKIAFMKKLNEHTYWIQRIIAVMRCRTFRLPLCYQKYNYYRTTVLPVILYVYETWPLTLREEHSLRMLEKRVLRKISGPKTDEVTGGGGVLWSVLLTKYSSGDQKRDMWHRWGRGEVHTGFWWGNLRGKIQIGRLRRWWEDNIKTNLQQVGRGIWNGLMSLRIGWNGGLLWMRKITSGFH